MCRGALARASTNVGGDGARASEENSLFSTRRRKAKVGKQAPFYGKAPRARRAFEDGPLVRDPRVRVRPGTAPDENNSEMTVCFAVALDQSKSRTRMREVVPYLQGSRFQKESYGNAVYEKRK